MLGEAVSLLIRAACVPPTCSLLIGSALGERLLQSAQPPPNMQSSDWRSLGGELEQSSPKAAPIRRLDVGGRLR